MHDKPASVSTWRRKSTGGEDYPVPSQDAANRINVSDMLIEGQKAGSQGS